MVTATGREMAKKPGRPKTGTDYVSVKLDRATVSKAKFVASQQGVTVAELLSAMLREPVDRAFAKAAKDLGDGGR